jgi:hypothetical protein
MSQMPALVSLFRPGRICATAGVADLVDTGVLDPHPYLARHLKGDWGDLCEEDRQFNNAGITLGSRLLSSYDVSPDLRLWIITEADRSVTTLLLPSEY